MLLHISKICLVARKNTRQKLDYIIDYFVVE